MNRLKDLRKEKNITLVAMSKELEIPRSTLNRYENGDSEPKQETWEKLADYFDVSVGYIMGISNQRFDPEKELEITRKIFFDILEKKELAPNIPLKDSYEKAFEYFNNNNLDDVLKTITTKFINDHPNPKNTKIIDEVRRINLYASIILLYIDTAKTNQNLIEYSISNLPKDIKINEYNHVSEKIEIDLSKSNLVKSKIFSKDISTLSDEATEEIVKLLNSHRVLTIYKYENGVDELLQSEINDILKETQNNITKLKERFPDKPSDIKQAITLIPNGVYGNGGNPENRKKYSLDNLNVSEEVKQVITNMANEFLNAAEETK